MVLHHIPSVRQCIHCLLDSFNVRLVQTPSINKHLTSIGQGIYFRLVLLELGHERLRIERVKQCLSYVVLMKSLRLSSGNVCRTSSDFLDVILFPNPNFLWGTKAEGVLKVHFMYTVTSWGCKIRDI